MIATTHAHVVLNRIVLTWEVDGFPAGVLTGYDDESGGLALEHVIAWRPGVLRPMLRAALEVAWEHGAEYVTFCVPIDWTRAKKLVRLGERLGFAQYEATEHVRYFVRHR